MGQESARNYVETQRGGTDEILNTLLKDYKDGSHKDQDINYNQGILLADEDAKGPVRLCLLLDDGPLGLFSFARRMDHLNEKQHTAQISKDIKCDSIVGINNLDLETNI
ncbi:hypothetical protein Leryth_024322 [Lithospermum erythrorhizon]|nr:hypothetical protein Leryth_024322 [Lithospermum erythrorhizon]